MVSSRFESRSSRSTYEARTPAQDFKVPIYVALRCDRQVDTFRFIESIKEDDSLSEKIIQMITENQSWAVNNLKIHSSIFQKNVIDHS